MHKFPCPKCGAGDIKISPATISGPDLFTASYGFTKYNYTVIAAVALAITG